MTLNCMNYSALITYSRILMEAPAGAAVGGVTERFHEMEASIML